MTPSSGPVVGSPSKEKIGAQVAHDVNHERVRQDGLWGEQNHDPFTWLAILGEEVGEAAKAALEIRFGKGPLAHYREELVQVAAVACAMVECIDRGTWTWPVVSTVEGSEPI